MITIESNFHIIKNVDYVGPHTLSTTIPNGRNCNITIPQIVVDKKIIQDKNEEDEINKKA